MSYKQGEILLVPFPFTNLKAIMQRPVLVLSNDSYNKKSDDLITCGITSNLRDTECSILINNESLEKGILPKPSRIKVDKLFTLEQSIVKKKLASLKKEVFEKVKVELSKWL